MLMLQSALEQAVRLYLLPGSAAALRTAPLPSDIQALLLILARDTEAEVDAVRRVGRPIEIIREAAEFYAVQILFEPQASAYRNLGAKPGASRESLRANMALLLRWLHPDSGIVETRLVYFNRVVRAWNMLGSLERRTHYDRVLARQTLNRCSLSHLGRPVAPFFVTDRRSRLASSIKATLLPHSWRWGAAILGFVILVSTATAWVVRDSFNLEEQSRSGLILRDDYRNAGNAIGADGRIVLQRRATYDAVDWR